MDGTDFRIREPTPFSKSWFSHKFKTAGLRYEVAVSISTGFIVWYNGPFACGENPDIKIFRHSLKSKLLPGEQVEADNGYRGEQLYISVADEHESEEHRVAKSRARARHEQINRMFKRYEVLYQTFRHAPKKHSIVFRAVVVLTQLDIQYQSKKVWQVSYTGRTYDDSLF